MVEMRVKLPVPFIQLPLQFDADLLAAEVEAIGESAWLPHPARLPGNSMLPLIAVDGDPWNESFSGEMKPAPALARCPYLMQVLASFGAVLGRTRLMRLAGQAEVTRHADQGYYWIDRTRIHVPIVTQSAVRFECDDAAIHMAAGECWIFDTWRQHRVLNDASRSRIHLVVDTVGGDGFWRLMDNGRAHSASITGWQPKLVAHDPGSSPPSLACETTNVPVVMTPWELRAHLMLLFAETIPHPQLAIVQNAAGLFYQRWRWLWALHGDRHQGFASYREALDAFMREVHLPGSVLKLRNDVMWLGAFSAMVDRFAVGQGKSRDHGRAGIDAADNG